MNIYKIILINLITTIKFIYGREITLEEECLTLKKMLNREIPSDCCSGEVAEVICSNNHISEM